MAKASTMDADLVNGLKLAKTKRVYFALILKGGADGALILSKTKVPPAAIAEAKKESGGSSALQGFCRYEEGTYIFETAKEAPATAPQAVKVVAKRDAGMAVKAEFRISTDPELVAGDGEVRPSEGADVVKRLNAMTPDIKVALAGPNKAQVQTLYVAVSGQIKNKAFPEAAKGLDELQKLLTPPAAPAPKADGAELTKRLNAMTPDIKVALAGPNKAQVQTLYVAVSGQIKNKAFPEAAKGLDELQNLLKPAASGAPQSTPQPDGAELTKRLNAMTPDIKAALAGPNKAQVQALFAAVTGQIKSKDFVQAGKGLDELEPLLKPSAGGSVTDLAAEWKAKLAEWSPAIKTALSAKGPNSAAIAKLLAQASALSKPGGNMAQAISKLAECHALAIGAGEPAATEATEASVPAGQGAPKADVAKPGQEPPPADEPPPTVLRSFVRTMAASRDWRDCHKSVAADLRALSMVILSESAADPRISSIQKFLDKVAADLGKLLDPKLEQLVLQLADASVEERPTFQREAAAIVTGLKKLLEQQHDLVALEKWPTMSLPLHSRLDKSLTALEGQLAG